jgi:glycine cleavage system aminomethyltransferase T
VPELHAAETAILACLASAEALDRAGAVRPGAVGRLPGLPGTAVRVAPDELWLLGPRPARAALREAAAAWLAAADPGGIVVDLTSGWAGWLVRGPGARAVLGRVSVNPPPSALPALLQGALAGVPGRVVVAADGDWYLVPAPVGHHLRDRILEAGADLGVVTGAPRPFPEEVGR